MIVAFEKNPLKDGTKTKLSDYSNDLENRILSSFGGSEMTFGSNKYGTWIRWENGLQVVITSSRSVNINTPTGSNFKSAITNFNMPAAFKDNQYVALPTTDASTAWGGGNQIQNDYCQVTYHAIESLTNRNVRLAAIGFWK